MNSEDFLEQVRSENQTALSRLGSSKSLYALTGGELNKEGVLTVAADLSRTSSALFADWDDTDVAALAQEFATVAGEEESWAETAADKLGEEPEQTDLVFYDTLGECTTPVERAAGLLGHTLVAKKIQEQLVGFFIGQADPKTSQTFRDYGTDLDDRRGRALDALETACTEDADWDTALASAKRVIDSAYEVYTKRLEDMGVNPKPVC
jgi:hypothetical protein